MQIQTQNNSNPLPVIPYSEFFEHWKQTYYGITGQPMHHGFYDEMSPSQKIEFWIGVFGIELGLMILAGLALASGHVTIGGISVLSLLGGLEIGSDILDAEQLTEYLVATYGMTDVEANEYMAQMLQRIATGSYADGIFSLWLQQTAMTADSNLRGDRRTLVKQISENLFQIYRWNPKTNSWEPFGLPASYDEINNSIENAPGGLLNLPFYGVDDDLPPNPHMHEVENPSSPINPAHNPILHDPVPIRPFL
jgi:hypothetical protein